MLSARAETCKSHSQVFSRRARVPRPRGGAQGGGVDENAVGGGGGRESVSARPCVSKKNMHVDCKFVVQPLNVSSGARARGVTPSRYKPLRAAEAARNGLWKFTEHRNTTRKMRLIMSTASNFSSPAT